MVFDKGLAQLLRDALEGQHVVEKNMMGGLCFMVEGHMLCGVHKGGAMIRVGKPNQATALTVDGVTPMAFTGRRMAGLVDITDAVCADDARRGLLLGLVFDFIRSLPAKGSHHGD